MFHNERKLQLIRTSFFLIVDSIPFQKNKQNESESYDSNNI